MFSIPHLINKSDPSCIRRHDDKAPELSNLAKFEQLCTRATYDYDGYDGDYDYVSDDEYDDDDVGIFSDGICMISVLRDLALTTMGMEPVSGLIEVEKVETLDEAVSHLSERDFKDQCDVAVIPILPIPIRSYLFSVINEQIQEERSKNSLHKRSLPSGDREVEFQRNTLQQISPIRSMFGDDTTVVLRNTSQEVVPHTGFDPTLILDSLFNLRRRSCRISRRALLFLLLIVPSAPDEQEVNETYRRVPIPTQPGTFPTTNVIPTINPYLVGRAIVTTGAYIDRAINRLPERVQSSFGSARDGVPVIDVPPGVRIGRDARRRDGESEVNACVIS